MNDYFAVTAVPEDDGSVRLCLQARSSIPYFIPSTAREFCDFRCQLLEAIEAYGEQTSRLVISPFCIPDQVEDRDMICNALSQLPNVRTLSVEESKESPDYYYGLLLPKLNQLLELFQHRRLEELHFTRVMIRSYFPDDIGRLQTTLKALTHLKKFRSVDTIFDCYNDARPGTSEVWRSVAGLPKIETFHFDYGRLPLHDLSMMNPTFSETTLALASSKSLKHVFLKGYNWSNLGRIASSLIGTGESDQLRKRHHSGDRQPASANSSSLMFESLHFEGPGLNKEGLVALLKAEPTRVKRLSLVNLGGCDFVDDNIIRALAKVLQHNKALKHLHIHPMESVTAVGYKALLDALELPSANTVLEHFPLEGVQNGTLSQDLRRLLSWNKYGLRRYATVSAPDANKFHADIVHLLTSHPRGSPLDERDLLDILFGLFSGNVGLLNVQRLTM